MEKEVRKEKVSATDIKITLISAIFVVTFVILILIFLKINITGKVVYTPSIPSDCSDSQIKSLWDSIFYETSDGITIFTNTSQTGKCNVFSAYKINGNRAKMLLGMDIGNFLFVNMTLIMAIDGNFTQEYLSIIKNMTSSQNNTLVNQNSSTLVPSAYLLPRNINSLVEADADFRNSFKANPSNWIANISQTFTNYQSFENETLGNETKSTIEILLANYTLNYLTFTKITINPISISCTPNWTAHNTSCQPNERLTTYFTDSKNCNSNSGQLENLTLNCDYDKNGIIGNVSVFKDRTASAGFEGLFVYINNTYINLSQNYSNRFDKVEIRGINRTIIEFNWNFTQPLDLDNIRIEKQGSGAKLGYILVNGIPVSKKLVIDRLNSSSTQLCARNYELSSISDLSSECTGSEEIIVDCPGTVSGISCSLNSSLFIVNGLTHSAARELVTTTSTTNCTPNWNCTSWTACSSGVQSRNCTDTHFCSASALTKSETQICSSQCTPNWQCENWTSCSKAGNQSRICTDENSCNETPDNKQTETRACDYKLSSKTGIIIILVVLCVLIGVIVIAIIYYLNKSEPPQNKTPVTQYGYSNSPSNNSQNYFSNSG